MNLSSMIEFLSINYIVGISVFCTIVVIGYLVFSIRLIVTSRREGLDVCMTAMIPIVNVFLWFKKCIRRHKNKKILLESSRVLKDDEEIEL